MIKKVLSILLLAVLSASFLHAQINFGIRAGLNFTNFYMIGKEGNRIDLISTIKPGFQLGIVAEYPINRAFSIQSGLLFAQHGEKIYPFIKRPASWVDFQGNSIEYKHEFDRFENTKLIMNLNYLQLPVNVQYKFDFGNINLLLHAGPYLGYGISGKIKIWDKYGKRLSKGEIESIEFNPGDYSKIKFGNDKEKHHLKALDFGIGLGAGLKFNNIQFGLGYIRGLTNILIGLNSADDKRSSKNKGFSITVSYFFGN